MSSFSSRFGVFGDRNFALFSLGNTISWLGMWAQRIGIGWLSWDLSHSATWVGLVSLSQFLPLVFLGPLFGGLLDRSDAKRYAIVSNIVLTVMALALYVVTVLNMLSIEILCLFSVLLGIGNSAYQPVRLSIVNEVAPKGRLAEAIAANSLLFNVTRTAGPALAGLAIASMGVAATFLINAISYAAIIGALMVIEVRPVSRRASAGFIEDFVAGVRYAAGRAFIRDVMLLSVVTSMLGRGVMELLPAFAGGLYQRGSAGLATMTTACGIGAIAGAALLSKAGSSSWLPVLARRGAISLGGVVMLLGLAPLYWMAVLMNVALGLNIVISSVGLQVMLQKKLDESYRGRVLGLWGISSIAGPGVGGALMGTAAQWFGLRYAAAGSGLLCMLLSLWIVRHSQELGVETTAASATDAA